MNSVTNNLDLIQVASPCTASWEAMSTLIDHAPRGARLSQGEREERRDERVRFCGECRLNVYNLSEMGREEAEEFVRQREGRMCVRFFRREDGTVLTKDCPVGVRALRQRLVRAVAAICGILFALVSGTLFGNIVSRRLPGGLKSPGEAFADWIHPERGFITGTVCPPAMMGGIAAPPPGLVTPVTTLDPAETPLLEPTREQMLEIQRRLEK
jgi:hypothetical protein